MSFCTSIARDRRASSIPCWRAGVPNSRLLACLVAAIPLVAHAGGEVAAESSALEEVVVTAHAYKPIDPSPAAKIQADNHDLPITVDQVTSALLSDRAVVSTDEAIDTVAGVRLIPGYPGASGFLVRGFFEAYNVLVDGFRDEQALFDPQGIERIDVLKGPPSVLFGAQSPGGVINFVSKTPQDKPHYAFEALGGSYDERRATADVNQPFFNGQVLTRLNATYDDAGNFRDFVTSEGRYIAPTVTFKLSPSDVLNLKASYVQSDYTYYSDFPIDPHFLAIPISRALGEPGLPQSKSSEYRLSYDYSHDFGGGWRFRSALGYNHYKVDHGLSRVYYPTLESDGRTLDRTLEEGPQSTTALTAQEEIYGHFTMGPVAHELVAGIEYYNEYYPYVDNFAPIAPLDIVSPVYGAKPGPVSFGYAGENGDHNVSGYLQDLASFATHWKVLAGARYDRNSSFYQSQDVTGAVTSKVQDTLTHLSPRAGIVYQPTPSTSVYASWSKSFFPQIFYNTFNGAILPPDLGEQYEVGVKQDLMQRRLALTGALFHITRENVATPDPDPSHAGFYIPSGQQRSQGLELSAVGELRRGWNIVATYAYTDAQVTRDNTLPVGDRLAGVPKNAASLWTQYELAGGPLNGLGGGVGVVYSGEREAILPNTFTLASYARVDALAYYRFAEHYKVALNIKNLNNKRYYDTDGGYVLRPGAPFTALASVRAEF